MHGSISSLMRRTAHLRGLPEARGSSAVSAPDRPAVLDDRTVPAIFAATLQASAFGRMDAQTGHLPKVTVAQVADSPLSGLGPD